MRSLIKFLALKNIYSIFVIYFFYGYFFGNKLNEYYIYENFEKYLGNFFIIFLIILGISPLLFYMKNKMKKIVLKTRLFFFVILTVSLVFGYILEKIYLLNLDKISSENKLIEMSIIKYNIGIGPTYVLTEIFKRFPEQKIFLTLGGLIGVSSILLFMHPVRRIILYVIKNIKEKRERRQKEILLEEQIAIKEELEKREIEAIEKLEEKQEQEIQERLENFQLFEIETTIDKDNRQAIRIKLSEDEIEQEKNIKVIKIRKKISTHKVGVNVRGGKVKDDTSIKIS